MKKALSIFLCLTFVLFLSACMHALPEGWSKKHLTYKEALAFAKSIDPNAMVAEEYADVEGDSGTIYEFDMQQREWDAVINGVHCHVASVSDRLLLLNERLGEVVYEEGYFRIGTDYDYALLQNILSEDYPQWNCYENLPDRYRSKTTTIFAELTLTEYRMLSDDELEQVWQTVCEIREKYEKAALERKIGFKIPSPNKNLAWTSEGKEYIVTKNSYTKISDFSEEGKSKFIQEYKENWAQLESGLPVYD